MDLEVFGLLTYGPHQAVAGQETQQSAATRDLWLAWKSIEDRVRERAGITPRKESSPAETRLWRILISCFPMTEMIRHYRPPWLENLEIDIFMPSLHLAIEYQGQQHFYLAAHWGGQEELEERQKHDARKADLCLANGITLVYFIYDQPLTEEYVRAKIEKALSKT